MLPEPSDHATTNPQSVSILQRENQQSQIYMFINGTTDGNARVATDLAPPLAMCVEVDPEGVIRGRISASRTRLGLVLASLVEALHDAVLRIPRTLVIHDVHGGVSAHRGIAVNAREHSIS